ncbi:MAG TPA: Rieske 2Fe-2S domain-containing protein [Chloroflexota bacterium]|nr:Rieske 2Fe-2S domain-containing protein [Chloroflexota bacterium]
MLSLEENDLLTRIGAGTPMGDLVREYWIPGLLTRELPQPDSDPMRVRLLGEDLIAFRDTTGRIGVLQNHCPHRGASLFFGRNEESGLRCVYHGWKFDVDGQCIDMPNEPAESDFRTKVKATAYPTAERNGVVWVYMGSASEPPPLPALEWNLVPPSHVYLTKRVAESNWVQTLEGEIDSSHSGFLHTVLEEQDNYHNVQDGSGARLYGNTSKGMYYKMKDKHPHFEVLDTDYGVLIGARRAAEEDSYYWRLTQFLMPFHTVIPPYGEDPAFSGHAWIPIDDHHTLALCFTYHPVRPLTEDEVSRLQHGGGRLGHQGLHPTVDAFLPPTSEPWSKYVSTYNKENDYGIDYEAQRSIRFSGLPGIWPADSACQESMGSIYDRSSEHLGSSDAGIIRARKRLMNAARALRDSGGPAPAATQPEAYRLRSASVVLPRSESWIDGSAPFREAQPGVNFAAV